MIFECIKIPRNWGIFCDKIHHYDRHRDVSEEEFAPFQKKAIGLAADILHHIKIRHGLRGVETVMPEGKAKLNRLYRSHAVAIINKEIKLEDL